MNYLKNKTMKKTVLIILVMLAIASCEHNPKDLEYKSIPIEVMELAQQAMTKDTTLTAGDLFIIPGPDIASWDYVFVIDPETQDIAVDAIYPTTDPDGTIGLTILITLIIGGVIGGIVGYKVNS